MSELDPLVRKFQVAFARRARGLGRRIAKDPSMEISEICRLVDCLHEFIEGINNISAQDNVLRNILIVSSVRALCELIPDTVSGFSVALAFCRRISCYREDQVLAKESRDARLTRLGRTAYIRRLIRRRKSSLQLELFAEEIPAIPLPPTKTVMRKTILVSGIRNRGATPFRAIVFWKGNLSSKTHYAGIPEVTTLLAAKVARVLTPLLGELSGETLRRPTTRTRRRLSEELAA